MDNFLLLSAQKASKKDGSSYWKAELSTNSEVIKGVWWEDVLDLKDYVGKVVECTGTYKEYNGEKQYNITGLSESTAAPEDYCVKSKYDVEQMRTKLLSLIKSIKNDELRCLVEKIFEDALDDFTKHTAAKSVHHAFVGGLLQHTIFVTIAAAKLAEIYTLANKDVVIAASLLHDIGKLQELTKFPTLDYTRIGNCVGHTALGLMLLERYGVNKLDELTRDLLLNCIASHHGELEYGAVAHPVCIEAFIVHAADYVDSKVEVVLEQSKDLKAGEVSGLIYSLGSVVVGVDS